MDEVTVLRWYTLDTSPRLDDAEALAFEALAQSADHPYGRVRAWFIDMLGTLALVRGDATTATRYLEEAAAVRRADDRGSLAGSLLALTAATRCSETPTARTPAFIESTTTTVSVLAPFVESPRADAARLAARGRIPSARSITVEYRAAVTTALCICTSSGDGATPPATAP